jgi:hypothetical protein
MNDPNLVDFYGRVAKINHDHSRGYGFESVGTLGRSYYNRPQRKSALRFIMPVVTILLCTIALKGAIHHSIGGEVYQARVDALLSSEGIDRLGGYLMMADPATVWLSGKITETFGAGI